MIMVVVGDDGGDDDGASVRQSSEQAPFTSEIVSSILAIRSHAKRVGQKSK
jgi:hypothetical protein